MMGVVAVVEDKRQLAQQDFVLPQCGCVSTSKTCKWKEVMSGSRDRTLSTESFA